MSRLERLERLRDKVEYLSDGTMMLIINGVEFRRDPDGSVVVSYRGRELMHVRSSSDDFEAVFRALRSTPEGRDFIALFNERLEQLDLLRTAPN